MARSPNERKKEPIIEEVDDSNMEIPPSTSSTQPAQKRSSSQWFTFDDIPTSQWRDRIIEFQAWLLLQTMNTPDNFENVLREFAARFTGSLKDWFTHLGEYRQIQYFQSHSIDAALGQIFHEFIGDPSSIYTQKLEEFYGMRCCSFARKDLDYHYKRMQKRFHFIRGIDNPFLKYVLVRSFPKDIVAEVNRKLTASNEKIDSMTIGQIY